MSARRRRLLTIGHSYVVTRNRRFADALADAGGGEWAVTAVAPTRLPGDFGELVATPEPGARARLETFPMRLAGNPQARWYGGLRALMRQPWDVVHCWEEPFVAAGAQVARLCPPGARLVVASFQNLAKRYPPPFSGFERASLRRADGWIAFGHTVEATLAPRPIYAARPHTVIPPGVDTAHFAPDRAARAATHARLGWNEAGAPVVGYLGRFVAEKGVSLLTTALDAVASRGAAWRALFVGGGPMEPALREWAARHGDRVRILTDVTHDAVPEVLNGMDLLCAPSQTTPRWREQFGRMLVEAFACGIPVVGSDSGEIPHVIGGAGVVLPEADADAWTTALARLLADPAERARLGMRGRVRAETEFAWDIVAARHLAFFETLGGRDPVAS